MAEFKRSRLKRSTDSDVNKKTVIIGLITVVLFVLIVIFGLPLLVKFSIFLGDIKKKSADDIKEKVLPPTMPRLIYPHEATNSAVISISGVADVGSTVELLKNEETTQKTPVNDDGSFNFDNISLDQGTNVFSAISVSDKGGSSQETKPLEIDYDNQPPNLTLDNPATDNITIDKEYFDISGTSEKNASVTVNDQVALVDEQGKFKFRVQLSLGKNQIDLVARDAASNETKKTITITYDI